MPRKQFKIIIAELNWRKYRYKARNELWRGRMRVGGLIIEANIKFVSYVEPLHCDLICKWKAAESGAAVISPNKSKCLAIMTVMSVQCITAIQLFGTEQDCLACNCHQNNIATKL